MNKLSPPLFLLFVASLLALSRAPLIAQETSAEYLDARRLEELFRSLARDAGPGRAAVVEFGRSREGRALLALRIGRLDRSRPVNLPPGLQLRTGYTPTLLLVTGLESDALLGSSVLARLAAKRLALDDEAFASAFADHDLLIVPRVDLDGSERYFATQDRHDLPGSATPIDHDRDARELDEDQPGDLDGDGLILEMRQKSDEGRLVTDEKDPRLLVPADARRRGVYLTFVESLDADGDGDFGEDPKVGVRLDRNFPHRFREHDLASGLHPMSEPETRALAEFILAHPEIAMVVEYGVHDNLAKIPDAAKGPGGRGEARTAPAKEDRAILEMVAELLKAEGTVFAARENDAPGSLHDWTYYQLGLPSFAICLFEAQPADSSKGEKKDKKPKKQDDESAATDSRPSEDAEESSSPPAGDIVLSEARRAHAEDFRPWTKFVHPQLGGVEIGGFLPYARRNPKAVQVIDEIAQRQDRFLTALAGKLPRVSFETFTQGPFGDGLCEFSVSIVNDGEMPTTTAQGRACRRPLPLILSLEVSRDHLVQGELSTNLEPLAGLSGRHRARWLVQYQSGDEFRIHLALPHGAPLTMEFTIQ